MQVHSHVAGHDNDVIDNPGAAGLFHVNAASPDKIRQRGRRKDEITENADRMIRRRHNGIAMNSNPPIIRKDVPGYCNVRAITAHPARTVGYVTCVMPATVVEKAVANELAVSR